MRYNLTKEDIIQDAIEERFALSSRQVINQFIDDAFEVLKDAEQYKCGQVEVVEEL